jgi:hypothetical protein
MDAEQLLQQAVFGRTFGFAVALGVITCLASAAIPAWRAGRVQLNDALKEGAGSLGDSRRLSFLRGLFVVVQSALAVTLLTGAGLLIRTVHRLNSIDLGFASEGKLVVSGSRGRAPSDGRPPAVINAEIARRLAALPGVSVVAQSSSSPAGGGISAISSINVDGAGGPVEVTTYLFNVDADFFAVMGMPLLAGEGFAGMGPGSRPVVVVSESIARRYFRDGSPIGRSFTMNKKSLEIVGVVRDIAMGVPGNRTDVPESGTVSSGLFAIVAGGAVVLVQSDHEAAAGADGEFWRDGAARGFRGRSIDRADGQDARRRDRRLVASAKADPRDSPSALDPGAGPCGVRGVFGDGLLSGATAA